MFPDEEDVLIVDDFSEHYILGVNDDESNVYVYCEWCDSLVDTLDSDEIFDMGSNELYQKIVLNHHGDSGYL